MQIQITFTEAVKNTFEAKWFYQRDIDAMNKTGEELQQILIDDYFNGMELAVKYKGYSLDLELFYFELMPG